MSSAQVGKTECLLNVIGYHIHQDPAPLLIVQPNEDPMAQSFMKDRVATMIRDTPVLNALVSAPKGRDSANTILHKMFPGGHLTATGANSPAGLATRPIRIALCDEVDKYPFTAGVAGDPVSLAKARTKTFWNRKLVLTSTPTIKDFSRIETAYGESDQRKYWVPCPDCGHMQVLEWSNVRWEEGKPETAMYVCVSCGVLWNDAKRWTVINRGEWRAEKPFSGVAGFQISELYSPWARLADLARAFLDAKHSRSSERMQQWVNETLGKTFEAQAERLDDGQIQGRGEHWVERPDCPVTTCGIDVQDDRVELELVGWNDGEESWSLDYRVIYGDPSAPTLWADIARYLNDNTPAATCIDSGGHYTQAVYAFAKGRLRKRVYATKGMAGPGRPVWPKKASRNTIGKVHLFLVGVDAAKDIVYSRLRLLTPGAGFCHFPDDRDDQYFRGLTCEVVQTRFHKGFPIRYWKKPDSARNEPLDCRVLAYAALCSLTINWATIAKRRRVSAHVEPLPEQPSEHVAAEPSPEFRKQHPQWIQKGNWVTGWRG